MTYVCNIICSQCLASGGQFLHEPLVLLVLVGGIPVREGVDARLPKGVPSEAEVAHGVCHFVRGGRPSSVAQWLLDLSSEFGCLKLRYLFFES